MPATEQTWRDSKLLHVLFGVTSLVMLLATVWMLAADHNREWKHYQREFSEVETWTADARIQQSKNDAYLAETAKRKEAVEATREVVPDKQLITEFEESVRRDLDQRESHENRKFAAANFETIDSLYVAVEREKDGPRRAELRDKLLNEMRKYIGAAKFREDNLSREKKSASADFDVARSEYEIAVGNTAPQSNLDAYQKKIDEVKGKLDALTLRLQDAKAHRLSLEQVVAQITADEVAARKALDDHEQTIKRLEDVVYEREDSLSKRLLELPVIDAFGRPLKIENIWLPKLTINNNFRDVARFDRCTTCHQGLDKTAAGSAVAPLYRPLETQTVSMATPAEAPVIDREAKPDPAIPDYDAAAIRKVYGLQFAKRGLLKDTDVTISVVVPESPAAKATLAVGDVVAKIGDKSISGVSDVYTYLLSNVKWGTPLNVTVRRGVPNPYTSHPRLDLFVGSLSPHKLAEVGCTICHEGQGSATDFKWASHSPSTPMQGHEWTTEHGWFNNHHWIYPMAPKRLAESTCLKCHHNVAELEPSERFPDPPAPNLMTGYHTIRQYGCFGCHEVNGYDGPARRVGPDLRAEPNYSAAAQALLAKAELDPQQQGWAARVAHEPADDAARRALQQSLRSAPAETSDEVAPDEEKSAEAKQAKPAQKLSPALVKLVNLLDDVETPGKLRKVGPSLRHVASKVDYDFLYSWIRRPKDFRPNTKMPQFFGLTDHLSGDGLKASEKFEPLEIRGVSEYLLAKSQKFEFAEMPQEDPSADRGKKLFETRGCLACHKHKDFPAAKMVQGPDLSNVGGKLGRKSNPNGAKWLYSWLRDPSRYHPRTLMPNVLLEPIKGEDGKMTDPADDIAAYLFSSRDWQPKDIPSKELSPAEKESLEELALEHLKAVFPRKKAEEYLQAGIPESVGATLKGDEVELVGNGMSIEKKLQYVGRRTISKYGCSGCHDVPGFEDAKPIGTGLADWGRKAADKLAFEQIAVYLTQGHGGAHSHTSNDVVTDSHATVDDEARAAVHHEINFLDMDPDTGFYLEKLFGHERTGFIWQKLREPRSYDYQKTENKGYNERLRMPKFNIDQQQIEAVITFVLGLVAEPPAPQYVYAGSPRRNAIVEGQKLVEKYNCGGCHMLQMDQWKLAYQPGDFNDAVAVNDYPQLIPKFTPAQIKASLATDSRGLRHAQITGMPVADPKTGLPIRFDEDGAPIEPDDTTSKVVYSFMLWNNVLINGQARQAGVQNLLVPESAIEKQYPADSGYLAKLIYPTVVADEKKVNPNVKADEAWGWLPPPLAGEGRKVQSSWLHDFLLDPVKIRPAVVLRMPKFNMSSDEASTLANYFAALDNVAYPYNFDERTRGEYLAAQNKNHPNRLDDALKIVTDNNYCIKCHIVGDWEPSGSDRAKGPPLDQVYRRLRPGYLSPWIANPKRIIPYTGMPVNVPYDKPVNQDLYHGTSDEQVAGLVDLLLNFDRYAEGKTNIRGMIKNPPPPAGAAANDSASATPPNR